MKISDGIPIPVDQQSWDQFRTDVRLSQDIRDCLPKKFIDNKEDLFKFLTDKGITCPTTWRVDTGSSGITSRSASSYTSQISGSVSPPKAVKASGSSTLQKQLDTFFTVCGLDSIEKDDWEITAWAKSRMLDTGTDEAKLETLLRSFSTREDFEAFRSAVVKDRRATGNSFDEILKLELSGRDLGRLQGIISTLPSAVSPPTTESAASQPKAVSKKSQDLFQPDPIERRIKDIVALGTKIQGGKGTPVDLEKYNAELAKFKDHCVKKLSTDYQKTFDMTPAQLDKINNVSVLAILLTSIRVLQRENEYQSSLQHSSFGMVTDTLRQDNVAGATFSEAHKKFKAEWSSFVQSIKSGQEPSAEAVGKISRIMESAEREFTIYKTQEAAGQQQVSASYQAAEFATYTVVGACVALATAAYLAPVVTAVLASSGGVSVAAAGTSAVTTSAAVAPTLSASGIWGGGVLGGGLAGTAAETTARVYGDHLKNEKTDWGHTIHESATNAFSTSLGFGLGTLAGQVSQTKKIAEWATRGATATGLSEQGAATAVKLTQAVTRNILSNQLIGLSHAVLRADSSYGFDDAALMMVSGFVGGATDTFLTSKVAKLGVEASREFGENLAQEQFLGAGNISAELMIGSAAGALTELGGGVSDFLGNDSAEIGNKDVSGTVIRQTAIKFRAPQTRELATGINPQQHELKDALRNMQLNDVIQFEIRGDAFLAHTKGNRKFVSIKNTGPDSFEVRIVQDGETIFNKPLRKGDRIPNTDYKLSNFNSKAHHFLPQKVTSAHCVTLSFVNSLQATLLENGATPMRESELKLLETALWLTYFSGRPDGIKMVNLGYPNPKAGASSHLWSNMNQILSGLGLQVICLETRIGYGRTDLSSFPIKDVKQLNPKQNSYVTAQLSMGAGRRLSPDHEMAVRHGMTVTRFDSETGNIEVLDQLNREEIKASNLKYILSQHQRTSPSRDELIFNAFIDTSNNQMLKIADLIRKIDFSKLQTYNEKLARELKYTG